MSNLIALLANFNNDNRAQAEKLLQAISAANQGKAPTIDSNGRLHAPCNGYEYNGSVYGAGEFLSDEFQRGGSVSTAKVKIAVSLIDQINENWACVSFGKAWTGADGIAVCYAYFECLTRSQADTLKSAAPTANRRKMMLVDQTDAQGLKRGTSWKFNARKYANALNYCFDALMLEVIKDGIDHSEWDLSGGKFNCVFKGKEVCFVYPDKTDYFTA